jgi:hypothetical protein
MARAGDDDAADVLKTLIVEAKSRRAELPTELEAYNMELLGDDSWRSRRSRDGPKKKNKLTRDMLIALAVAAVVDRFGLPPTGRSIHRRSAASIVAEALAEIGLRLGFKAVEHIWRKYHDAMPTVPGWTIAF